MRVALLADLHIGVKKSDPTFMDSQMRFFEKQFVEELKEEKIDKIIICGDVFDTRQSINVQAENTAIELFKTTLKDFDIHIIIGNHDIYHTNTLEVNSLKSLDLLPNVTVYDKPTELEIDNKKILMLPWVTNYEDFDTIVLKNYDYAFAHLDIVGFEMGGGKCINGVTIKTVADKIRHTYTGHYHCRSRKTFQDGTTITYVGSPYQITRIDKGTYRGYGILNLENDDFVWKNNKQSMLFKEFIYPEVDENQVKGNVVDIKVPYDLKDESKKIYDLTQKLNKLEPAYQINLFYLENTAEDENIELETENMVLEKIFKNYIEQRESKLDKDKLYRELMNLYNTFRGAEN